MSDEKIGSLEQEALKRKERLQSLKMTPKFRSYKPQDESLKSNILKDAKAGDVEAAVQEQLNAARSKVVIDQLDISNLAPRKSDWDLKRDIAQKQEILDRRTQKAIADEVRSRLKQGQQNLAAYVNEPEGR